MITDAEFEAATLAMEARRAAGIARACRYDGDAKVLRVTLSTGVELGVPTSLIEGLAESRPHDIQDVEVSPTGLGLFFPKLDLDISVPGLLAGVFGSKHWMDGLRKADKFIEHSA